MFIHPITKNTAKYLWPFTVTQIITGLQDSVKRRKCRYHQFQRSWWWRGKVIGGTGAINTMLYMRGNAKDYDNWASLGNSGWSFRDCLPYFRKLEDMRHPQLQHGK